MIPYGKQSISQEDIDNVVNVLKSDFLTQGPTVGEFEIKISDYCNAKYAVAVSNATSALHISCLSLNINSNSRVWTSPNTFVASANCALYCGSKIDFVDIDKSTYNISISSLRHKLIDAKKNNTLPDLLIPVHFSGQSCDMKEIYSLSKEYGFQILEDSSHAIGGEFNGEKIGSCQFSSLNVFSFHPVKIITTGEGGIITTNDKSLYEKLTLLRSHGITKDSNIMTKESEGPWYYQQLELGFNYRITDIQAALGISQLSQLDKFVDKRNELANRYNLLLSDLPVQIPLVSENRKSSFHLYVIRIDRSKVKKSHKIIFTELKEKGIGVQLHYIPVHLQPYYESIGFKLGDFPEAETYYNEAISLPMYYDLTFDDQNFVVQKLKEVIC